MKVAVVDGVTIMLYENEHPPPHFHAKFAEFQAVIDIEKVIVSRGKLPPNKTGAVLDWARSRQTILREAFELVRQKHKVGRIP
jgi:hypothetical protein